MEEARDQGLEMAKEAQVDHDVPVCPREWEELAQHLQLDQAQGQCLPLEADQEQYPLEADQEQYPLEVDQEQYPLEADQEQYLLAVDLDQGSKKVRAVAPVSALQSSQRGNAHRGSHV